MKAEYKRQLAVTAIVTLLFCAGGSVLIVLGTHEYNKSKAFKANAQSALGRVIGFETYDAPGSDLSDDIHYAVVLFTLEDGREIRFQGPSRDGPVNLHKGDEVTVLYNPEDPTDAKVDNFMGLWFSATMLAGLGAAAILIPLLTLWQAWKWCQRQLPRAASVLEPGKSP